MFIKQWESTIIPNAPEVEMVCSRCGNKVAHKLHKVPIAGLGFVFSKTPIIAKNKYAFVCPVCGNMTKEINKDQLSSLRK
jgi:predicted RNA-binding Zn-ribbon protein involved in translation (DUF1610 family)